MKGERAIVRNRPRSCCPDDGADIIANFRGVTFATAHDSKLHPDRGADVVFVFHFRLSKRRDVADAQVDRHAPTGSNYNLNEIMIYTLDGCHIIYAHLAVS